MAARVCHEAMRQMTSGKVQVLDTKGLLCPLPALMARKRLRALAANEDLVVEATDPMAEVDIGLLAREHGLEMEITQEKGVLRLHLRRR